MALDCRAHVRLAGTQPAAQQGLRGDRRKLAGLGATGDDWADHAAARSGAGFMNTPYLVAGDANHVEAETCVRVVLIRRVAGLGCVQRHAQRDLLANPTRVNRDLHGVPGLVLERRGGGKNHADRRRSVRCGYGDLGVRIEGWAASLVTLLNMTSTARYLSPAWMAYFAVE